MFLLWLCCWWTWTTPLVDFKWHNNLRVKLMKAITLRAPASSQFIKPIRFKSSVAYFVYETDNRNGYRWGFKVSPTTCSLNCQAPPQIHQTTLNGDGPEANCFGTIFCPSCLSVKTFCGWKKWLGNTLIRDLWRWPFRTLLSLRHNSISVYQLFRPFNMQISRLTTPQYVGLCTISFASFADVTRVNWTTIFVFLFCWRMFLIVPTNFHRRNFL